MTKVYVVVEDSEQNDARERGARVAARVSAALAVLFLAVTFGVVAIGSRPSASAAKLRSMFSCLHHGFKSLDDCLHAAAVTKDFAKYKPLIHDVLSRSPETLSLDDFLNLELDCPCKRAGTCAVADDTLVTAIFDIHRSRFDTNRNSFKNYTEPLKQLLKRYPQTPKVVFVQKGYGAEVAKAQPGFGYQSPYLCLIEADLADMPEYGRSKAWAQSMLAFFDKYKEIRWPQTLVPDYDILMASKAGIVARAATQNVFKSSRFAWVDGGLHPPMTVFLPDERNLELLSCGDKVCIGFQQNFECVEKEWERRYKEHKAAITFDCNGCMMGATLTGIKHAWLNLAFAFEDAVQKYLDEEIVDCDQGIFLWLYLNSNVLEGVPCMQGRYCPGYMFGGHKLTNASSYTWTPCDPICEPGWWPNPRHCNFTAQERNYFRNVFMFNEDGNPKQISKRHANPYFHVQQE